MPISEDNAESQDESYRMDNRRARQKRKQRKLDDIVNVQTSVVVTMNEGDTSQMRVLQSDYMLEDEEDDGLN